MSANVDETSPSNPSAQEHANGKASYQTISEAAEYAPGNVAGGGESTKASTPTASQTSVRNVVAVLLVGGARVQSMDPRAVN